MKTKKYRILVFFVLFLIVGCGGTDKPKFTEEQLALIPFAQKTGLPEASGGFALAVGGETITCDEVIMPLVEHFRPIAQSTDFVTFKRQAGPQVEQVVINKISDILICQQTKRQAGEQIDEALEKAAEAEVRKFIVSFDGDYARAEQELKQKRMDWQSFKEYQKKVILTQSYIASQLPRARPITYSELMDYYNEMKDEFFLRPAMLKFQLIDIQPEKLEIEDPNQSRLERARELANELLGRLQAGEDFGELALAYSHGHRREFDGLWKAVQPGSLAAPYDILAARAEKIQPGQIAGPIEAAGHIFIMKLVERLAKSVKPLEKVQREVKAKIISDRRQRAVDKLGAELMQQAALAQNSEFVDFCLEKIYRISNQ